MDSEKVPVPDPLDSVVVPASPIVGVALVAEKTIPRSETLELLSEEIIPPRSAELAETDPAAEVVTEATSYPVPSIEKV